MIQNLKILNLGKHLTLKDTYKKSFILIVLFFSTTFLYNQASTSANQDSLNIEKSTLNEIDVPLENYCNNLEYESVKFHTLKNIESIDIEIVNNKEWNENLFRAYISLEKNNNIIDEEFKKRFSSKIYVRYKNNDLCTFESKVRIHGDYSDHLDTDNGVISSIDVDLISGNIDNITKFKLFLPMTREYKNEIFVTSFLKSLGFYAPRSKLLDVKVNGNNVSYIFQEKITKEFLEINNLREAPIYEMYESIYWQSRIDNDLKADFFFKVNNINFLSRNINNFIIGIDGVATLNNAIRNTSDISGNETLELDYQKFKNNEELGRFDAALLALGADHGLYLHNRKFYFNPASQTLSPLYYDGGSRFLVFGSDRFDNIEHHVKKTMNHDELMSGAEKLLFTIKNHELNKEKLLEELSSSGLEMSEAELKVQIDKFVLNLDRIKNNKSEIKEELISKPPNYQYKSVNFKVLNNQIYLCELNNCEPILIEDTRDILNNNLIYEDEKAYLIQLNKLSSNVSDTIVLSNFEVSTFNKPKLVIDYDEKIIEISINNFNERIVFQNGDIEDWLINIEHSSDITPGDIRNDTNLLTGCVSFKDIQFKKSKIVVSNSFCEDAINFINTSGEIDLVTSINSNYDAIDLDFSNLLIRKLEIEQAQNDCVDFSYGNYIVDELNVKYCGDKGVSIGEKSKVNINNAIISESNIGVAIKDSSEGVFNNLNSINNINCVSLYQKKQEFGPSKGVFKNLNCGSQEVYIQEGSVLIND